MDKWEGFLYWIFGESNPGYVCVGYRNARSGAYIESFFRWPTESALLTEFVSQRATIGDVYFCTTPLRNPKRTKPFATAGTILWADLDTCPPERLLVPPSVVVETSPGRWHAYWKLDGAYPPNEVEALNKRIAHYHKDDGCGIEGWALSKLLRIPETFNHKYYPEMHPVKVIEFKKSVYKPEDFKAYPEVEMAEEFTEPMPRAVELENINVDQVLLEAQGLVNAKVWELATEEPQFDEKSDRVDWSKNAWMLMLALFEAGRTRDEVFKVLLEARCNKFLRDKRPNAKELLWSEVLRAEQHAEQTKLGALELIDDEVEDAFYVPKIPLLTDNERKTCSERRTVIEEYIEWARTVGDAAVQYHEAGAFVILSTLLSGSVQLYTSYGKVIPNLWFMILADTTLTRKTTAMDLAMDILADIDSDMILATDGSIEGLMTSLSMRPGRPSVFLRDEFSGFLEQVTKRDYYAGMLETLTKLYDAKLQKRVLRKETIEVREPRLILFTGGIKAKIYDLLSPEHINSGFIPRFCFITAESDVLKLKPLGPPDAQTLEGREVLLQRFRDIFHHYNYNKPLPNTPQDPPVRPEDTDADDEGTIDFNGVVREAVLTPEAWRRYNKLEQALMDCGVKSSVNYLLTPVMARLAQSGLKAAILLAAASNLHEDKVAVGIHHIQQAFYYVERWKQHVINVVANSGKSTTEKELERVYTYIQEYPGVTRSKIMQQHYLTARTADAVFSTLLQRGLVRVEKGKGKQEKYFPVITRRKARSDA